MALDPKCQQSPGRPVDPDAEGALGPSPPPSEQIQLVSIGSKRESERTHLFVAIDALDVPLEMLVAAGRLEVALTQRVSGAARR